MGVRVAVLAPEVAVAAEAAAEQGSGVCHERHTWITRCARGGGEGGTTLDSPRRDLHYELSSAELRALAAMSPGAGEWCNAAAHAAAAADPAVLSVAVGARESRRFSSRSRRKVSTLVHGCAGLQGGGAERAELGVWRRGRQKHPDKEECTGLRRLMLNIRFKRA